MIKKNFSLISVWCLIIFCPGSLWAQSQPQPGEEWEFSSSVTVTSGDYGTSETTRSVYVPFTLTRFFETTEFSVTVPLIYQDTGTGVSAVGGIPAFIERGNGSRSSGGLGDVLLSGKFQMLEESVEPYLTVKGVTKMKIPTADDRHGLGTGEFDLGFGVETSKTLDSAWSIFFDMYYTFIGDPPGRNLNNEFAFAAGTSYELDRDNALCLFYEERTALIDRSDNPRSISVYLTHQLEDSTAVFGGLSLGLSDGSPDFGLTAGLSKKL